jgi:hypothetical protein
MKKYSQQKISAISNEAASCACDRLDKYFPGYDNGGITSNFMGSLVDFIEKEINKLNDCQSKSKQE